MKEINKLEYRVFENLGVERPDVKELTDKINELVEAYNDLTNSQE